MTPESPAVHGLPAPYDRDPEGWMPKPANSPRARPGRRFAAAQAAFRTLYGPCDTGIHGPKVRPPAESRHLILLAAAACDAAALQSVHAPRYTSGLETRAYLIAWTLWDYDQAHGTSRGPVPAAAPHWIESKHGNLRTYVRQELTALLDAAPGRVVLVPHLPSDQAHLSPESRH